MDIRHLRYFVALAEERSFTRAAARLNMAQPPLSRQIRQIEDELGVSLLDHGNRPLRLTDAGETFRERAAQILTQIEELRAVTRRVGERTRRLTIGFVGSTLYGGLPVVVRRYREDNPAVILTLVEMITVEQLTALKEGRIDVGVGRIRLEDPAIRRELLREEALVAALPLDHSLVGRPGLRLADLVNEPLIVYPKAPRPSYADQVLSLFRDHGLEPLVAQEVRELQTALGLVVSGAGICVVPESVQRTRNDDVVYVPITDKGATSPILMSHRLNDTTPEVAAFLRLAEAYADKV